MEQPRRNQRKSKAGRYQKITVFIMNMVKTILFVASGYGLLKSASRAFSLKKSAEILSVNLKNLRNIKSVNGLLGSLRFHADVAISNPSAEQFTVRIPVIKVYYAGSQLAYTTPTNAPTVIKPYSDGAITNIQFQIPYQKLLTSGVVKGLLTNLTQMKTVIAQFTFYTMVEVNGVTIEYKGGIS